MDTSIDPAFLASMIEAVALTFPPETAEDPVAAAHAALAAMQPRDLIEAMLAARMIAAHHASIDSYRRAMLPGLSDPDVIRLRASAVAASRSFDAALRMLEKRRAPATSPRNPAGATPRPRRARARKTRSPATRPRRSPRRNMRWTTTRPTSRGPKWSSASRCIAGTT